MIMLMVLSTISSILKAEHQERLSSSGSTQLPTLGSGLEGKALLPRTRKPARLRPSTPSLKIDETADNLILTAKTIILCVPALKQH